MKKFLIQIICFSILVFAIFLLLAFIFPPYPSYLTEHRTKRILLEKTDSPRIIFIGGSNLAFGLNSKVIKDSLGMNVVNTGLQASLGLKNMLDDAEPYLREGDNVFIAAEYPQLYNIFEGSDDNVLAKMSLIEGWSFVKTLNYKQLATVIEYIPESIKLNIIVCIQNNKLNTQNLYSYNGFNEFGDFTEHWNAHRQEISIDKIQSDFDYKAADYVADKLQTWQSKGINVYMIPPVVIESYYSLNKEKINLTILR